MTASAPDVIVVGAGLAGLAAAIHLTRAGRAVHVLEASDDVGGRQHTDVIDGFRIDRGFAIHNTGYPEAKRMLDHDALDLAEFVPGALVIRAGRRHRVVDPHRVPSGLISTATSGLLSLRDKAAIGALSAADALAPDRVVRRRRDVSTRDALRRAGVSDDGVAHFLQPFLQGVLADADLVTSARFFHLLWRAFARGTICLPAEGIQAIPRQLAAAVPAASIRLGARVEAVAPRQVTLADGEQLGAGAVVVACDPAAAGRLLGARIDTPQLNGLTTIYHVAARSPLDEPILVLDSDEPDLIANTTVMTQCAPTYSSDDRALIQSSVVGPRRDDPDLVDAVTERIARLYDMATSELELIATRRIDEALPSMPPPMALRKPVRLEPGLFVCGDHRDTASIQGALVSGRRAAAAVLGELGSARRPGAF